MYAAIKDGSILGLHEDIDVVKAFADRIKDVEIVKLKKKKKKELRHSYVEDDLYLFKFGNSYYPHQLYSSVKSMNIQRDADFRYCRAILLKMKDTCDLSDKDKKRIDKVIKILDLNIGKEEDVDYETARYISEYEKEMDSQMGFLGDF